jgi:hypothetical protein
MKQNITKEQWNELNEEQQKKWYKIFYKEYIDEEELWKTATFLFRIFKLPNIGQMIEFLDNDIKIKHTSTNLVTKKIHIGIVITLNSDFQIAEIINLEQLCDILWETIKYKLCILKP